MNTHGSHLPSEPDERLQVGFTDPPLAAEPMCDQLSAVDPAADRLGRDLEVHCCLRNGQKCRKGVPGQYIRIRTHGSILSRLFPAGIHLCRGEVRIAMALETQRSTRVPPGAQVGGPGPASYRFADLLERRYGSHSSPGF